MDNDTTRGILETKPVSSKTLRKCILSLTPHVEKWIAHQLPERFGLLFDGRTLFHYVALFATYVDESNNMKEYLLSLAPLINDEELGAQQHIEFIGAMLLLYSKSLSSVLVLVGDNCNTNRKISKDIGILLLCCASQPVNLLVNHWINLTFKL